MSASCSYRRSGPHANWIETCKSLQQHLRFLLCEYECNEQCVLILLLLNARLSQRRSWQLEVNAPELFWKMCHMEYYFVCGWLLSGLSIWHHVVPPARCISVAVTSPKTRTVSPSTIITCLNELKVMPPFQRHWVTSASYETRCSLSQQSPKFQW